MKLLQTRNASPQSRDPRLTALNFIADAVNRSLDLKEIADNAIHAILSVTKLDAGAVYLWNADDGALRLFSWRGLSEAFTRQVTVFRKGDNATIDAVLNGTTKLIQDFRATSDILWMGGVRAGFKAAIMSPIRSQGFVVGILTLGRYSRHHFTDAEVELVEGITQQIGNALVHAQLESDLRASEEQYRGLVENSDDAIYITKADGRPRFANSAFARIFGFESADFITMDAFQRIHPNDVEGVQKALEQLRKDEAVQSLEYRFLRKDGVWIDLQCNASVFARSGNRPTEFQFVVREVTQARQRQQQLLRRNQQLAALTSLAAVANSSLNIDEIARNTLQVALENAGLDAGCVHLLGAGPHRLQLSVAIGLPEQLIGQLQILPDDEMTSGVIAATGQVQTLTDRANRRFLLTSAAATHGMLTLIAVPITAKGEMLGKLSMFSRQEMQFAPEVVEMVTAMGNQLGIAVANARLYEAQLRENEKLNALLDITGGSQGLDLDPLLQRILEKAGTLLKADGAYVARDTDGQATIVAGTGECEKTLGLRYGITDGVAGQVRAAQRGGVFDRAEINRIGNQSQLVTANASSLLVVPLISRNQVIGTIGLIRKSGSDFTEAELALMQAFATRAAAAIDNAELLKDLTGKNKLLELLIEEAHHRIKNNLQMVSGLLQLEAASAGTKNERLHQAIARIQAIAQVHNLLSSEMPEKVDAQVLITTILHSLTSTAPQPNGVRPSVTTDLEHLWLGADHAVPLSLIVNELVANALLHGQPSAGKPLEVHVSCRQQNGQVRLQIIDNGGGFPAGYDWRKSDGQGMNIVAQLAQVNLRGKLQIASQDGGVRSELEFDPAARAAGALSG
jgi:PAS domain S-box-containing protein